MKQILTSSLFEDQLNEVLKVFGNKDVDDAKKFKLYLDAVIINMHTKVSKYKESVYLKSENVKDIENQGYIIPFYCDHSNEVYVLLGIYKKDDIS